MKIKQHLVFMSSENGKLFSAQNSQLNDANIKYGLGTTSLHISVANLYHTECNEYNLEEYLFGPCI